MKIKKRNLADHNNDIQRKRMSYYNRKYVPASTKLSIIISIVSVISFMYVCIYSAFNGGNAGLIVGIVPMIAIVLDLIGFILAYVNFKKEDVRVLYVTLGAVLNAILVILYLFLYLTGF